MAAPGSEAHETPVSIKNVEFAGGERPIRFDLGPRPAGTGGSDKSWAKTNPTRA